MCCCCIIYYRVIIFVSRIPERESLDHKDCLNVGFMGWENSVTQMLDSADNGLFIQKDDKFITLAVKVSLQCLNFSYH